MTYKGKRGGYNMKSFLFYHATSQASVLAKYEKLQDAIEEYIEAVSKNVFCWGYELGREEQKHDKDQSFV